MKHFIIALAALISLNAGAQIGSQAIIKQRAKDVANQNNNRGTQPPQPGAQAAPQQPHVSTTPLTAGQQAYARFQSQLFAVNTNTAATLKPILVKDMAEVAQGANKPSTGTLTKLSDHLTTAYAEAKMDMPSKTRLAQCIAVLLNSANTAPNQKEAMLKDVETILKNGGASEENASAVVADLKTVIEEVKPK